MKWTSIFLLLVLTGQAFAQYSFQEQVYFDSDQSELTNEAQTTLDQLMQELPQLSDCEITLFAHTDDVGTLSYNKALANRRAKAVQAYLAKHQIKAKKTTVASYGEENPAHSNADELGRSKNRRVDVIINTSTPLTLDGFLETVQAEQTQQYTIDGTKDNKLVAEQGTTFWIAAGSLVLEDGSLPTAPIEVTIREAYSYSDMILNGLSTHASDQLLETGGMVYIEATADGKPLTIKEGQAVPIALPGTEFQSDMQLFTGEVDAHNNVENWAVTERSFGKSLDAVIDMRRKPRRPERTVFVSTKVNEEGKPKKVPYRSAPRKPKPPSKDKTRFHATILHKIFWSKDKRAAKEQALYEQAVANYEERLRTYERRQKNYKAHLVRRQQYLKDLAVWEKEVAIKKEIQFEKDVKQYQIKYERYLKAIAKWEEERLEKLTELDDFESVGNVATAALSAYFTNITDLGWINCDRFRSLPEEEKTQLVITDNNETAERIFVVFNDSNSILRTNRYQDDVYRTNFLPKNANVTIIGLKFEGRHPMLAKLTTQADAQPTYELEYKPYSLQELKAELVVLNRG